MAYIGRSTDKLSNIEVLDVITFDGSSSYTLQKNSVNFTPSSANNVLVSIDGVVQANNFTVSGSTIDFGVAVPSTSTCDWIYHIGVGLITTPADGTITTAKLADSSVSLAKLTATGTKDATTFLRGDNTFSTISAGITEADQWRITADITADADPISANWERVDNTGFGYLGTGMSVSSGVWTFPSTGVYLVMMNARLYTSGGDLINFQGHISIDGGSSYTQMGAVLASDIGSSGVRASFYSQFFVDVTSTSLVKVKFVANSITSPSFIEGNTSQNETGASFIRLGDT